MNVFNEIDKLKPSPDITNNFKSGEDAPKYIMARCCGANAVNAENRDDVLKYYYPAPAPGKTLKTYNVTKAFQMNPGVTIISRKDIPQDVKLDADMYSFIADDGEEICFFLRNKGGAEA